MEALRVSKADLTVYVHPSMTRKNNVHKALSHQLSSLLFKYNESFDGIILAHKGVKIQGKLAKVLDSLFPYLAVRLKAKLLIFSPKPDMHIEGKVTTIGSDFIRAIVLGISVATISFNDIRDEFNYHTEEGEGILQSSICKKHVIRVGSIVRFLVKSVDVEVLGDISGSLMPENTGCVSWIYLSKARHRGNVLEEQNPGQDLQVDTSKKHKSKRKRVD